MKYSMKGQSYVLPRQISSEQEAERIRWLASYSNNQELYEAARTLINEYDIHEYESPIGKVEVPGLLFKHQQDRRIVSNSSIKCALSRRYQFIEYLLPRLARVNSQIAPTVLKYVQQWFSQECTDAFWWCESGLTNEEIEAAMQSYMKSEFRRGNE